MNKTLVRYILTLLAILLSFLVWDVSGARDKYDAWAYERHINDLIDKESNESK